MTREVVECEVGACCIGLVLPVDDVPRCADTTRDACDLAHNPPTIYTTFYLNRECANVLCME